MMRKMRILFPLLGLLVLLASCDKNEALNPSTASSTAATEETTIPRTYRDYDVETEESVIDVQYPQFSEYSKKVNQIIKEAAYPILDDIPNAGKYNVVGSVKYNLKLQSQNTVSVVFDGYKYMLGTAHPVSVYHTINVDLKTGGPIRLSDVIDITLANMIFLLNHNRNQTTANYLAEEVRARFCDDKAGLQSIADADTQELVYGVFSYFTPETLVIRLPWYDKHVELEIPWDDVRKVGLKYDPR